MERSLIKRIRKRVFEILEIASPDDRASRFIDSFIVTLISLNVAAVILTSVTSIADRFGPYLYVFKMFSLLVFAVEYVLRLWSCTNDPRYSSPIRGRIKFFFTPLAVFDLLAVLPLFLPMFPVRDLRMFRIFRLFRFITIFKLKRYDESMNFLNKVFNDRKEELTLTVFSILAVLIIASCLMFFLEHEAQPDVFSSIPQAMWWGVATLSTVGYGDAYPITAAGRFFGSIIAFMGIGLFALPAGILSSGFRDEIKNRKRQKGICPHCGKEIR